MWSTGTNMMLKKLFVLIVYVIIQTKLCAGDPLVLDIRNINPEQFTVGHYSGYNSFSTIYTPKASNTINLVKDGREVIWMSRQENERCSHLVLYGFPDGGILAYLFIVRADDVYRSYFEKNGEIWVPLDRCEFFRKFDGYRLETPKDYQITLDIHSVNMLLFKVISHQPYGANALIFMKKHEGRLARVSDNHEVIWESRSSSEECIDVVIYCGGADFILGHLFITSTDRFEYKFFEKVDNKWIPLERNLFYEKLCALDKIEDEKRIRVNG